MNSPKNQPNELHGNFKQILLAKYKQPLKPKQENHNHSHNKFFGFLHKQKDSHIPLRTSSPIADRKNKKKEKQLKDHKHNHKEHQHRNAIWQSDKIAPLVQSKWIVEHIDYPNHANRIDTDSNVNITKIQRNQNVNVPQFRRFGDTNILRNQKKPLLTKLINEIPTADNIYRYLQSKNATNAENGVTTKSPLPHAASNAKDTGFSSMDGDQTSSLYSQFNSRQYVNVNQHQNRIRSNNVNVASPATSPSNNRVRPLNNKNFDRSPNISSSNSNSSDINSLDSMEHEIIHSKNNNQQSDSMSYLGPFNFRQLLRPTQGPTDSLRKRKGINLSLTPPPLQKGKI